MGASLCFNAPVMLQKAAPLRIRYLLDVHSGSIDAKRANTLHADFAKRLPWKVFKGGKRHHQYTVMRVEQ